MKQRTIYNRNLASLLFLVGYLTILSGDLLDRLSCRALITDPKIGLIGYTILASKIIYDLYHGKTAENLLIYIGLIFSGIMTYFLSGQNKLLELAIILLAASGVNYRRILTMYVSTVGSMFLTNFLLLAVGIKEQSVVYRAHEGHRAMGRYSLGTWGCNMPLILCVYLIFAIVLIYQERLNIYFYLVSMVIAGIIYYFTDQRGAMIALIIAVALLLLVRNHRFARFINRQAVLGIYALYTIGTLTIGLLVDGQRFTQNILVNTFVSRLMAFGVCRKALGFTLFGKSFEGLNFPVDIMVYNILFSCGIIGLVLLTLAISKGILCKNTNAYILVVWIGNIILWVFEVVIFSPVYNLVLLSAVASMENEDAKEQLGDTDGISKLFSEDNQNRLLLIMQAGAFAMFVGHTIWSWLKTMGIGTNLAMGVVNLAAGTVGAVVACGSLLIYQRVRVFFQNRLVRKNGI